MQVNRPSLAIEPLPLRPWRVAVPRRARNVAARGVQYALGVALLIVYIVPFAWMILGSLRLETEIFQFTYPLSWHTFVPVVWSVMVPLYIVVRTLHLQDTYWALVLPWYASPFVIFALIQFFKEIPRELDEAATMDGASHLGILRHVIVPNALPGLITTALLEFQFIWNLFYWPLIAVGRKDLQ